MKRIVECDRILGGYEKPESRIKAGLAANISPATAAPKPGETGLFTRTISTLAICLLMHEVQTDLNACQSDCRLAANILWQTGA